MTDTRIGSICHCFISDTAMNHFVQITLVGEGVQGTLTSSDMFSKVELCNYKNSKLALPGAAQWIECRPVNQKDRQFDFSEGTCLAVG